MRGNKHTFFVINIYINNNTIQVDMVEQLEECKEKFGEDVSTLVTSTETKEFFEVREDSEQLSDKKG